MNRHLLLTALLAVVFTTTVAFAPSARVTQDPEQTQLGQYMEDINKTLRGLRRSLRDPEQNADSLRMIRSVQLLVVQAKNEIPARLVEIPEAEREAFVADYARGMCAFLRKLIDLEEVLIDGDNAEAQELRNQLTKMKSPAHEKFKKRDDDEEGGEK